MARAPAQVQLVEAHRLRGPEPIGSCTEASVDMMWGLGLAGAAGSHVPIGLPSGTAGVNRFSGDCGPIQTFGRGPFMGATPSIKRSLFEEQSPGNPGVSAIANPVLLAMMNNASGIGA